MSMRLKFNGLVLLGALALLGSASFVGVRSYQYMKDDGVDLDMTDQCYVKTSMKQDRFSLNPFSHFKDKMNEQDFYLPLACDKASKLKVGEKLFDKFRWGSLLSEGSFSDWVIEVKEVKATGRDQTSCKADVELSQTRFSLDPYAHIKDLLNSETFAWEMPCSVLDQLSEGDNLLKSRFRAGSAFLKGQITGWALKVQ